MRGEVEVEVEVRFINSRPTAVVDFEDRLDYQMDAHNGIEL